jgi:hypothetical protein
MIESIIIDGISFVTLSSITKELGTYRENLTRYVKDYPEQFPGGVHTVRINTVGGLQKKVVITESDSKNLIRKIKDIQSHRSVIHRKSGVFAQESYLRDHLSQVFTKSKIPFTQEFKTGCADCRCDFLIRLPNPFLLELKRERIKIWDIYQCYEYTRHTHGKYPSKIPIVIIGHSIDNHSLERAEEYNIDVYLYNVVSTEPPKVEFKAHSGNRYEVLDNINKVIH